MENSNEYKSKVSPKQEKWLIVGLAICFTLFGLIFFCSNIYEHTKYNKLLEGGNYTYGKVTEITYTDNGTDGTTYTAEGIYTVDQQDYYFYFKCDNTTYEGELIKVLFDGEDPSIYALKKNFIPTYVFSGVFIFIGCFVLCLALGVFVRQRNLTDADFYRMKIESEKRAKMIEEIDDVWNYDITNLNRNKKSYKKENPYMDERIYKDRTIQTKPNSAKVRMGTTAFYKKEK